MSVMESMNQQKDDEHSTKQSSISDNTQFAADRSLLSIKTLEPWHIPEHCMVSALHQLFSQLCAFHMLSLKCTITVILHHIGSLSVIFQLGRCRSVTEFEKLNRIGEGTYGIVCK